VTEEPVLFGPGAALLGILTRPASESRAPVAFVMFNAGVLPRVGPHRLNVKMARSLARAGQTSLRFDLAGHGDSRGEITHRDMGDQAVHDLRCAMDYLEQNEGIRHFALIGYCSGAVSALSAAVADPRVTAVLIFDGHWYRSRWTVPVRRWKRFRALPWADVVANIRGRIGNVFVRSGGKARAQAETLDNPPRAAFVRAVQVLADRGVATLFMYSGSVLDYYSYAGQFRDVFGREPFFDKVRCEYRPDLDHTFLSLESQRRMLEVVHGWLPEVDRACQSAK
jgi:alpha/beta superfamily hydrolase